MKRKQEKIGVKQHRATNPLRVHRGKSTSAHGTLRGTNPIDRSWLSVAMAPPKLGFSVASAQQTKSAKSRVLPGTHSNVNHMVHHTVGMCANISFVWGMGYRNESPLSTLGKTAAKLLAELVST